MMTVILGGSGSGKSAYAENYIEERAGGRKKYYLATMQVYDEETEKKVARHRQARAKQQFFTIEQQTDIRQAKFAFADEPAAVLLECMSNLVANEMFGKDGEKTPEEVIEKVLFGVKELRTAAKELVIVSNNVFEDGIRYDDGTMQYLAALGLVNRKLAELADEVVEVVVGIPVCLKRRA